MSRALTSCHGVCHAVSHGEERRESEIQGNHSSCQACHAPVTCHGPCHECHVMSRPLSHVSRLLSRFRTVILRRTVQLLRVILEGLPGK
eukprot:854374-Amorphochlora_amoeboformis.AAC.1